MRLFPKQVITSALLSVLLTFGLESYAAVALKVSLSDGSTPTYLLTDKPIVTFDEDYVHFTTAEAQTKHLRSNIVNITFAETSADQTATIIDEYQTIKYVNSIIEASGRTITLYTIDGRVVTAAADHIDMKEYARGIYIARAGNQSIKIKY